jgi:hypothetical protein
LGTREQRKALIAKLRKELVSTKREIYRLYSVKTSLELTMNELLDMERCSLLDNKDTSDSLLENI